MKTPLNDDHASRSLLYRSLVFSFGIMAWFFSTFAFVLATAVVVLILYNREFNSDVLGVLRD